MNEFGKQVLNDARCQMLRSDLRNGTWMKKSRYEYRDILRAGLYM